MPIYKHKPWAYTRPDALATEPFTVNDAPGVEPLPVAPTPLKLTLPT